MKTTITYLPLLALALIASGCDMLDMPKTTEDMNNKMSKTIDEIQKSNAKMSDMRDEMSRTFDEIQKTNSKMTEMQKDTHGVKDDSHLQVIKESLSLMLDEKNTKRLLPVPFDMLPGAKKFAESAFEDELVDWFYVQNMNLVEATADDHQRISVPILVPSVDANGKRGFVVQYSEETKNDKKFATPLLDWVFPEDYVAEFNHKNDVTLNAMEAVASFIPQPMIEKIVKLEIETHGLREQTAYLILNFRDAFTRTALLKNSLYENKLKNLEQVREAARLVQNLDYIASLPYAEEIGATQIRGYLNISENYVYAQQARAADLANIGGVDLPAGESATQAPAKVGFDPSATINNPNQAFYTANDDGLTVTAIDQNEARTANIKYDAKIIQKDWKELQRHFLLDVPKKLQNTPEGQSWLTDIKSHIH